MKKFTGAVFMDIQEALDKVWQSGLIHTLTAQGLPTQFIRFIHNFISHRHMFFKIHNIESSKIKMNFGVPQGSSLSPLLFIIYVSDIPKPTTPNTKISQFADDIKLYTTSRSLPKI